MNGLFVTRSRVLTVSPESRSFMSPVPRRVAMPQNRQLSFKLRSGVQLLQFVAYVRKQTALNNTRFVIAGAFTLRLAFEEMPVRVFGRATICPFCLQVDQIVIFWVVEFAGSSD
jgi:hypothetical protein